MSQPELLKKVISALNQSGIDYMVTGSVASSLQGEPRSTHDIDVIVAIRKSDARRLVELFPPSDFYIDEQAIIDAIDHKNVFNLIDVKSGYKVDFWILTDDPFDHSRFSRKQEEELNGLNIQVSTPEDTILAKLRWANLSGGSEKQFTDALRVYEVQLARLDLDYLKKWADILSVEPLLKRLMDEAETI
jgi:hypothetical protein